MRRKHDFYPTPGWATQALLQHYPHICGRILEPCAGDGHISKEMLAAIPEWDDVSSVWVNDIDPERTHAGDGMDARDPKLYEKRQPDWVISNPPFNVAMEILKVAHQHATHGVAFLLRLSFMEPTYDRGPWLNENPPNKVIVLPRISFTNDGNTDMVTCAWFIWHHGKTDRPIVVVPKNKEVEPCQR